MNLNDIANKAANMGCLNDIADKARLMKARIAERRIVEMLHETFFSICAVDDALRYLETSKQCPQSYAILHGLHCIHFNEMDKEIVDILPELINNVLCGQQAHEVIVNPIQRPSNNRRRLSYGD